MIPVIAEDAVNIVLACQSELQAARGKTFLITGAGGMVGGYVVHSLMELGRQSGYDKPVVIAEVHDATHVPSWLQQYEVNDNFQLCVCNVEVINHLAIPPVDYIIHAASPASPSVFRDHPLSVMRANVLGTLSTLELARANHARLCLISSLEVYGSRRVFPAEQALSEHAFASDDPLDVRSAYPESKRMAENICASHRAEYGTDFVIARLGYTYGPGMKLSDTRVQAQFIRSALDGQGITMRSDGKKTRAYTYIADACTAILLALLNGTSGEAYNISNNDSIVSIKQLAETILAQAGPNSGSLTMTIDNAGSHMWSRMDTPVTLDCGAINELGWRPRIAIKEGVERTLRHYREESQA
ncbi:MAG: NAD-dependent epimerase/dehydratase family protein [Gammaproteobacteria bacterium]